MTNFLYYRKDLNRKPYLILKNHEYNWKYNNNEPTYFFEKPKEMFFF
jgi:hypothetical protein